MVLSIASNQQQQQHSSFTWRDRLTEMIALDLRSLAMFRVLVGLISLGDLLDRLQYLTAHYTDDGVVPREIATKSLYHVGWWSAHLAVGSAGGMLVLFAVHAVVALLVVVGYRTRLMTACLWLFCCSLQARNIVVLHGGDTLLRLTLFYAMMLPIGKRFSIDRMLSRRCLSPSSGDVDEDCSTDGKLDGLQRSNGGGVDAYGSHQQQERRPRRQRQQQRHGANLTASLCSLAFMLQLVVMYWYNYVNKSDDSWVVTGHAGFYALRLEYFRTWFGTAVLQLMPLSLLALGTKFVLYLEGFGWLLFFVPVHTQYCRLLAVVLFVGMHVTFALCLAIGMFGFIAVSTVLTLVPSIVWDRVLARQRGSRRIVLRYNPIDPLADLLTRFLVTFVLPPDTRVLSMASGASSSSSSTSSTGVIDEWATTPPHSAASKMWKIGFDGLDEPMTSSLAGVVEFACRSSPVWWWLSGAFRLSCVQLVFARAFDWYQGVRHTIVRRAAAAASRPNGGGTSAVESVIIGVQYTPGDATKPYEFDSSAPASTSSSSSSSYSLPSMLSMRAAASCRQRASRLCSRKRAFKIALNVVALWSIVFAVQWSEAWRADFAFFPKPYWPGILLRLDQVWSMFAPHPPFADSYIRIEGMQTNERWIDLLSYSRLEHWKGAPVRGWKAPTYRDDVGNHRWAKYFEAMATHKEKLVLREALSKYVCRQWNKRYPYDERGLQLEVVKIFRVTEHSNLDGSKGTPISSPLWFQLCYPVAPGSEYHQVWRRFGVKYLNAMGGVPELLDAP